MTPFSLIIMHQCVGSWYGLWTPSFPECTAPVVEPPGSSLVGLVRGLDSPYNISSSSSTVLLSTEQGSAREEDTRGRKLVSNHTF